MTTPQGQVPEALRQIPRFKIGHSTDDWGMRSSTPSGIPDEAGHWVRYTDHAAQVAALTQPAKPPGEVNWVGLSSHHLLQPAEGAAFAELPEPHYEHGANPSMGEVNCDCYTADQMRDYADRTYALRASHGQAPTSGVDPELGPMLDLANDGEMAFYDYAVAQHCRATLDILDGKDTGAGAANEPWASVRIRLLELVKTKQPAPAAGAVAGPGWKLVPLEPTDEMLNATYAGQHCSDVYRDMLAAAPAPAAQADSESARLLAECRDAFPIPERGSALEPQWMAAASDPTEVPGYLRAVSEAMQDRIAAQADSGVQEDAARWFTERDNVLHSFWVLLGEAETQADNDNNPVLKHQVAGFYRQWNAMTGDSHEPRWVKRATHATGAKP